MQRPAVPNHPPLRAGRFHPSRSYSRKPAIGRRHSQSRQVPTRPRFQRFFASEPLCHPYLWFGEFFVPLQEIKVRFSRPYKPSYDRSAEFFPLKLWSWNESLECVSGLVSPPVSNFFLWSFVGSGLNHYALQTEIRLLSRNRLRQCMGQHQINQSLSTGGRLTGSGSSLRDTSNIRYCWLRTNRPTIGGR